jgi:hypothetical protein
MGAAGKRLVEEKFSLRAMVESYERLYRALMAEQQQNCNT